MLGSKETELRLLLLLKKLDLLVLLLRELCFLGLHLDLHLGSVKFRHLCVESITLLLDRCLVLSSKSSDLGEMSCL